MKEKNLVKVVGTIMTSIGGGRMKTQMARGIVPMKRGVTLFEFIQIFLNERGIYEFTLHQRSDTAWSTQPIMNLNQEPKVVTTYHFVQFVASELGFQAKDLSKIELERDMKQLKKHIL